MALSSARPCESVHLDCNWDVGLWVFVICRLCGCMLCSVGLYVCLDGHCCAGCCSRLQLLKLFVWKWVLLFDWDFCDLISFRIDIGVIYDCLKILLYKIIESYFNLYIFSFGLYNEINFVSRRAKFNPCKIILCRKKTPFPHN